jgi:hypothetical protein
MLDEEKNNKEKSQKNLLDDLHHLTHKNKIWQKSPSPPMLFSSTPPLKIFFIWNRTPLRSLWDLFYWSYRKQIPKTRKRSHGGLMRKIDKRLEDKKINFFHYKQEINYKEIYEGRWIINPWQAPPKAGYRGGGTPT